MVVLSIVAITALAAIAGLVFIAVRSQIAPGPPLTGRTVVIHTREGSSVRGVLIAQHADRFTLKEPIVLHSTGEQPAGGTAHILVANIDWLQELDA